MGSNLPGRIRELREKKGWTQEQLAAAVGRKSKSTVHFWESGKKGPPSKLLPRIAAALDATVADLYQEAEAA